jgi:hypothetical protein
MHAIMRAAMRRHACHHVRRHACRHACHHHHARCHAPQAFEIVARPALDSAEAALDRLRMSIYVKCAQWGLPCPITGHAGAVGGASQQGPAAAAVQPPA